MRGYIACTPYQRENQCLSETTPGTPWNVIVGIPNGEWVVIQNGEWNAFSMPIRSTETVIGGGATTNGQESGSDKLSILRVGMVNSNRASNQCTSGDIHFSFGG